MLRERAERAVERLGAGQDQRVRLVEHQQPRACDRGRDAAGERARVVVAAGQVDRCALGDEVELLEVRGHRRGHERGDVGGLRARPGVDGDHRAALAARHHERLGHARRQPAGERDALAVELHADVLTEEIVAERGDERGAQPEPLRRDRGDRAAAGRAHEIARELLLAERGQTLEPDERQVQEGGCRDDQVGLHDARAYRAGRATLIEIRTVRRPSCAINRLPGGRPRCARRRPCAAPCRRAARRRAGRGPPRRARAARRRSSSAPPSACRRRG